MASLDRAARTFLLSEVVAGFLLYAFGFVTIGGEWFDMWMSHQWNGEESAFRFFITFLVILIFVTRRESGLRERVLAG